MKCEVCEGEVKLWSGKPRCWSCGHTSEVYDVILNEERETGKRIQGRGRNTTQL